LNFHKLHTVNKFISFTHLLLLASLQIFLSFGSSVKGQNVNHNYTFNHLIISDSEDKVTNLRFPDSTQGHILVMDVSVLNTEAFSNTIKPLYGKSITPQLFNDLATIIENFVKTRTQSPVTVIIPPQNISSGDIRFVVVIGRYNLARLVLAGPKVNLSNLAITESTGQISVEELPNYMASKELAQLLSKYFAKPITPESVNKLIEDLSGYIYQNGSSLAVAQIPTQNVEKGILKVSLIIGNYPLKKLVITDKANNSESKISTDSPSGLKVINNPIYNSPEFHSTANKYIGKPISVDSILNLKKELETYGKKHDRLIVETSQPYVDLAAGEVRIGVIIGRYSMMHLKGNRWFSDRLIEKKLGIKPGDEILVSELDNAVNWANQNPFRQVQVAIDTFNKPPGNADLDISVNEVLPVRLSAGFSNAINSPLGNSAYTASAQLGNLWGLDHELNYQYSTNNTPKYDQSHSLSYKIPFIAHDFITFDFAYSLVFPHSLFGYAGLNEKAQNTIANIKYSKPISRGNWSFEPSIALDYKQVNTNLFFGELTQSLGAYDVAQITLGNTALRKDKLGATSIGFNVSFSPGGFNSRNTELAYGQTPSGGSTGKSAQYEYVKFVAERTTNLPLGIQSVSRAVLQASTTNLQGSEELLIGGGATVRGYSATFYGDQGLILNQEFRSPYYNTHIPFVKNKHYVLSDQIVTFIDYGRVSYKHLIPSDVTLPTLMGAGIGLRSTIAGTLNLGADLSWPLIRPTYTEPHPTKGSFWISLMY